MIEQISKMIRRYQLLQSGQRVLVAISGGPDSVALAAALRMLGYEISLAHLNYGLRAADSDADEALVRSYADQWQVPLFVLRPDTHTLLAASPGETLQTLARRLRYTFFAEVMQSTGINTCATAHHADDQAETLLMRLLRGNSQHVLQGIPVRREAYIRPMLTVDKQAVLAFCAQHGLAWRKDLSNDKNDYLRNKIRNSIIPALREIQPDVAAQLAGRYAWYQQQEDALHQQFALRYEAEVRNDDEQHAWNPTTPDAPMAAYVLERWGIHGHALWAGLQLLDSQTGAWIVPMPGYRLARTQSGLVLFPERQPMAAVCVGSPDTLPVVAGQWRLELAVPGSETALRQPGCHYLALEALRFPLWVRPPQPGERMRPLGMAHGSKLISDILTDARWDAARKQQALVVADADGVVCVPGYRPAERVRIQQPDMLALRVCALESRF